MAIESTAVEAKAPGILAKAGKYLTFNLGREVYGIEILKVQEIIGMMSVTRVPKTPEFVRGVVNLRGKVSPSRTRIAPASSWCRWPCRPPP
jgi:purine-binding chemotaxis protein CheW